MLTCFKINGIFHNVDTIKSAWSIVYIKGLQVIISKKMIIFLSLKIAFI